MLVPAVLQSYFLTLYEVDTSLKWTPIVGPFGFSFISLILFKDRHLLKMDT